MLKVALPQVQGWDLAFETLMTVTKSVVAKARGDTEKSLTEKEAETQEGEVSSFISKVEILIAPT